MNQRPLTWIKKNSVDMVALDAEGLRESHYIPFGDLLMARFTPYSMEVYYKTQNGEYQKLGDFKDEVISMILDNFHGRKFVA